MWGVGLRVQGLRVGVEDLEFGVGNLGAVEDERPEAGRGGMPPSTPNVILVGHP